MRKNFGKKPWFYPLPVLIIGTYDENGVPDAMNAAYGGLYTSDMVEFSIGHNRKTFKNIQKTKAFTVSFADAYNRGRQRAGPAEKHQRKRKGAG